MIDSMTTKEYKYHCNYCGKKLDIAKYSNFDKAWVCRNPECPAYALVQIPVELLQVKRKKL